MPPPDTDLVNPDAPAPPPKRRRWLQFSVRSLVLLTLLCAAGAYAWRSYLEPYRQQRQTMALIEGLGGSYQTSEASAWLRGIYGGDFQNVVLVNLADGDDPAAYLPAIAALPKLETLVVGGPTFGDEELRALEPIAALRNLVLDSTNVTDDALASLASTRPEVATYRSDRRTMARLQARGARVQAADPTAPAKLRERLGDACLARCWFVAYDYHRRSGKPTATDDDLALLSGLTEIEMLALDGAAISDAALGHLKKLQKLHNLHVRHAPIGDAGLAHFKELGGLESLDLGGTRISDAGLLELQGFGSLILLALRDTSISDAGLENLKQAPNLQVLALDGTQITDAGLVHLKGLRTLSVLSLERTQITDAGLAHLAEFATLRDLHLSGTEVSDAGLAHLAPLADQLRALSFGRFLLHHPASPQAKTKHPSRPARSGPRITDAGVAHLKRFGNLATLYLAGAEISDRGLKDLQALQLLQRLDLSATQVSSAAVADFNRVLPLCQVTRAPYGLPLLPAAAR